MKKTIMLSVLALSLNIPSVYANPEVEQSKQIVKEFFGQLKGQLVSTLKSGGPTTAIDVCSKVAPGIAKELSEKYNQRVARTSLKLRNPANAPDAWEKAVLEKFEQRKAAGEEVKQMAFAETVEENGEKYFRFMKAIPTAEKPCLMCHGSNIKPEVAAKLDEVYPQDKARGFKAGDIRGAFTLKKRL